MIATNLHKVAGTFSAKVPSHLCEAAVRGDGRDGSLRRCRQPQLHTRNRRSPSAR